MNKKQAVYWLSAALEVHSEPEIVEAFKTAMKELTKQAYREELTQISAIYV
jgi:response regulator RpfG family c-di-GMP phosphodiesterase